MLLLLHLLVLVGGTVGTAPGGTGTAATGTAGTAANSGPDGTLEL